MEEESRGWRVAVWLSETPSLDAGLPPHLWWNISFHVRCEMKLWRLQKTFFPYVAVFSQVFVLVKSSLLLLQKWEIEDGKEQVIYMCKTVTV